MSPSRTVAAILNDRFPRVSGDEPATTGEVVFDDPFSPRERG